MSVLQDVRGAYDDQHNAVACSIHEDLYGVTCKNLCPNIASRKMVTVLQLLPTTTVHSHP